MIKAVETHVRKGAIVLSHDYAQPDTIAAYRTLLPWLQQALPADRPAVGPGVNARAG